MIESCGGGKLNTDIIDNAHILLMRSKIKRPFKLTVSGVSMFPLLKEGDRITILPKDEYEVGEVLVFIYGQNEILAHRLLMKEGGQYYCKGDNSFRIEP